MSDLDDTLDQAHYIQGTAWEPCTTQPGCVRINLHPGTCTTNYEYMP